MAEIETRQLFLLTREIRQRAGGLELTYWAWSAEGPVQLVVRGHEATVFVSSEVPTEGGRRAPTGLRTPSGGSVDALRFASRQAMQQETARLAQAGTPAWEADVKPMDRYLMERRITGGCTAHGKVTPRAGFARMVDPELEAVDLLPELRVSSFDIEAEGPEGAVMSIAIVTGDEERVFVRGHGEPSPGIQYFPDEPAVLSAFLDYVAQLDPDVLIGWNVIEFDLAYLEARCRVHNMPLSLGRGAGRARVVRGGAQNAPAVAMVPGRIVLDGIATMRAATWSFERWSLEHVAQSLLGRGKAIDHRGDKLAEIQRMYREDLASLIAYNLEDCRLVRDIFEAAHVLEFAIERQRLTGLTMDRRAGAVAAFDYLYLPRLHQRGRVAPTTQHRSDALASPGGFVMDSEPGLYRNVLVLDFKSLYPSIIRTFLVDPLGLWAAGEGAPEEAVPGFSGARFSRQDHILPGLIEELWAARDRAKQKGDAALSRAIKIQMNSFYGVLGTPACRFFDPRLASSITRRGHEVLQTSRAWIEEEGHRIIYGDTDSLFVLVDANTRDAALALGRTLAEGLNARWRAHIESTYRLKSALELELETCFDRFLMPTVRGSRVGSKKRYAGTSEGELVIKGLEAVRTDWTPLARRLQRELLRRVFADEPYGAFIRDLTDQLFAGALDDELVYRKRLRQRVEQYTHGVPQHVAAARQLEHSVDVVEYVITTRGPQPIQKRAAPLDYQHYMQKQLAPAADVVLPLLGEDFMRLGGRQLSLF